MTLLALLYIFLGVPLLLILNAISEEGGRAYIPELAIGNGALLLVALMTFFRGRVTLRALPSSVLLLGVGFILYLGVVTLIIERGSESFDDMKQLKALLVLSIWLVPSIAVFLLVRTERDLDFAFRLLDLSLLLATTTVFVNFIGHGFNFEFGETLSYHDGAGRFFGPLGDQVGFVALLGALSCVARRRWLLCCYHVTALLLTGTRGALIALLVGIGFYALIVSREGVVKRAITAVLVVFIALAALVSTSLGAFMAERFFDSEILGRGWETRWGSMQLGLEAIWESPFFGAGYGSFTQLAFQLKGEVLFQNFVEAYFATASNQFIQTGVEGGVIGILILVVLGRKIWKHGSWLINSSRGVMARRYQFALASVFALLLGNQTSVWLIPRFLPCLYVFILALLIERGRILALQNEEFIPVPHA